MNFPNSRKAYLTLFTAAAATTLLPSGGYAQSSGTGFLLEEITVTARRREESLQDVPGTVTAITKSVLDSAGVRRAEDFIALTPGVSIVDAAEVGDTQVNIRGINGARDAEANFAYVIDGILHTNPSAFNREYTNLRQIEIFKGPQGAIYGRSAAAGAVIVTTEQPGNERDFKGRFSGAQDDTFNGVLSYSGPIIEDQLYFSVSADWSDSDGFFRNSFQGDSAIVDAYEGYNFNGRLVWDVNEALNIDTKFRYGEVDASAITFNSSFNLPVFAELEQIPAASQDSNDIDFVFNPNIVSDNDQESLEFSSKFEYQAEFAQITGWVLYSDIQNEFIADGTSAAFGFFNEDPVCQQTVADLNAAGFQLPSPQFIGLEPEGVITNANGSFLGAYTPTTCDGLQEQLRNQEDLSFEVRFASVGDGPFTWEGGLYYLTIDRQVGVSLNRDSGEAPIRGLLQVGGPNSTAALVFDDFDTEVFSVFGQFGYEFNERAELSVALRYDVEDREVSSLVPTDVTQNVIDLNFDGVFDDPLNPGLSSLINPDGVIPDNSETFTELQPKVSFSYGVSDTTTLFASWGVGFKAGGFNNSGSAATVNIFNNGFIAGGATDAVTGDPIDFAAALDVPLPIITDDFDEETSNAFEVGFRSNLLGGRLQLDGAAYYTDVEDQQFFEFFVGAFGLLRVVSNIDEVEIFGAELAATYHINENFRLHAGASAVDSEIQENSSRPDTVGNESPYTPDFTLNFAADFNFPLANSRNVFARVDAQVVGQTWFHTVQEGQRPTIFQPIFESSELFEPGSGVLGTADFSNAQRDTYATVNFRAGVEGENWSVTGFISNLTDEEYLEEVIPAPEFGGSFNAPGARRRAGVEVAFDF